MYNSDLGNQERLEKRSEKIIVPNCRIKNKNQNSWVPVMQVFYTRLE